MLAARSNFNPKVCIIDNVPPSWEQENLSNIETLLMSALGVVWVGQDRFHVCHSFSVHFNNMHPLFRKLIITQWRNATTFRDPGCCEHRVDRMLISGTLTKSCTVCGTKLNIRPPTSDERWTSCSWRYGLCGSWQPVTNAVISDWKLDGSYHELFSTSPNVVVPEHVLEARDLKDEVEAYKTALIDEVFEPAALGADRHDRRPKLIGGKKLAEDVISTERYIDMYI